MQEKCYTQAAVHPTLTFAGVPFETCEDGNFADIFLLIYILIAVANGSSTNISCANAYSQMVICYATVFPCI